MLGSYAGILATWTYGLLHGSNKMFLILYVGLIAVSCGLYSIITLVNVVKSNGVGLSKIYARIKYA